MIRAYITDNFVGQAARISLVQEFDNGQPPQILRLLGDGGAAEMYRWDPIEPGTEAQPTLTLHQDAARALLDALTRHFRGSEDTRALRRDYDSERDRVDTLTGAVIDLARTLAGGPVEHDVIAEAPRPGGLEELQRIVTGRKGPATDG